MSDYGEVADLSVTELHVIQSIGEKDKVNVTSIAQHIGVTKSAISKITGKLLKKGLIERYQLADNQKEVFFRLTSGGESVFSFHERFHRRLERRMLDFWRSTATPSWRFWRKSCGRRRSKWIRPGQNQSEGGCRPNLARLILSSDCFLGHHNLFGVILP